MQTTFRYLPKTWNVRFCTVYSLEKEARDSVYTLVSYKGSKVTHLSSFFAIMPRGKHFDVGEKTIMTLFTEGVAPKEIAMRLKRNTAAVRKVIAANRDLPAFCRTSPPSPSWWEPSGSCGPGTCPSHWWRSWPALCQPGWRCVWRTRVRWPSTKFICAVKVL